MVDFALNDEGDMYISGGKLAEVHDPIEETKQRLRVALLTHRGEWLFDVEHGLPFTEEILVKNPPLGRITALVRAYVLTLEGITGVTECRVTLNAPERKLYIRLNAQVPEGLTGPFNVVVGLAS
jgi:hypothetical protein